MSTHTAPSGFKFTLRKPEAVPERLRRPVANKLISIVRHKGAIQADPAAAVGTDVLADTTELNDLMVVALVTDWSIDAPISLESLMDLPAGDYKALRTEVAPFVWDMFPDFDVTPEDDSPTTP